MTGIQHLQKQISFFTMHKSLIVMALALLGGASAYASGPYDGKGVPERWGLAGGKEVSATAATAVEETAWWTRFAMCL